MQTRFTPGPWTAGGTKPYKGNEAWIFDGSTPEKLICFLGGHLDHPRPSISESLANAHLIAAAPDLFKVIEELSTNLLFSHAFGGSDIFFAAKAAYNKALNK